MLTAIFYLLNVGVISLFLALFEIYLEKYKSGFGGEFTSPFWGRKLKPSLLIKAFQKAYVTPYHLIMFGLILPTIYFGEYVILEHGHLTQLVTTFNGMMLVPIIYLVAVVIGVMTLEDFLFFVFSGLIIPKWLPEKRFDGALQKLLRGEVAWHTEWVHISPSKMVPKFYLQVPVLVTELLLIQHLLVS